MEIPGEEAPRQTVALLAEGVDRNVDEGGHFTQEIRSPSSRRAWIEIFQEAGPQMPSAVALLAEGVDRNIAPLRHLGKNALSPFSRRAWIEIAHP